MTKYHFGYLDSGDESKSAVLFLHGFLGNATNWSDVAESLASDFRTILVDLPGHGKSVDLPDDLYTIKGCASELIALLDDLRIDKVNLVGYSMGGRVALYLATHYQERFRTLVLESSSAGLKGAEEREARQVEDERRAQRLESMPFEQFLRDWYSQPLFSSVSSRPELFEELVSMRLSGSVKELARSLRFMGTGRMEPLWDQLATLAIPTVCIAGELDPKFAALARQMAMAIPNCHAMIIPDAGHIVHFEQPDRYIARIHSFLSI